MKKHFIPYIVTILLLIVLFAVPLPYYAIFPGSGLSLEDVVGLEEKDGHVLALSARVYKNPYARVLGLTKNPHFVNVFIVLVAGVSPSIDLSPATMKERAASASEIEEENQRLFEESLVIGKRLAMRHLNRSDDDISLNLSSGSGSSAGLAVALEIIHQFGPDDLLRDRRVAAIGGLDEKGTVIAVGGVRQKVEVAVAQDVDLLLVPEANRDEVPGDAIVPLVLVGTLDQAISSLLP